jgi:hypothetical protein
MLTMRFSPAPIPQPILMPDAEVIFYPQCFSRSESDRLFQDLLKQVAWRQEPIRIAVK